MIDNYSLIGVISIRDISTAFDDEAIAASRARPGLTIAPKPQHQRAGLELSLEAGASPGAELVNHRAFERFP